MMPNDLLQKYDTDPETEVQNTAKRCIEKLEHQLGRTFRFSSDNDKLAQLSSLQYQYILHQPRSLKEIFYRILTGEHYEPRSDISLAFNILNGLPDFSKNLEEITILLGSPYIDDISFHSNQFTIESSVGSITWYPASLYFKNNQTITTYMENNKLANFCHRHAYFFAKTVEWETMTALCYQKFGGSFYHSFAQIPGEDNIVDLTGNVILPIEAFRKLLIPKIISAIIPAEFEEILEEVTQFGNQPIYRYPHLRIALYRQMQDDIDYPVYLHRQKTIQKRV